MFTNRDAFTKREQASEDYTVKQREMEKLKALKQKVADHKKHLDELDKNMYVLTIYTRILNICLHYFGTKQGIVCRISGC